jgi:hypothetical protein
MPSPRLSALLAKAHLWWFRMALGCKIEGLPAVVTQPAEPLPHAIHGSVSPDYNHDMR